MTPAQRIGFKANPTSPENMAAQREMDSRASALEVRAKDERDQQNAIAQRQAAPLINQNTRLTTTGMTIGSREKIEADRNAFKQTYQTADIQGKKDIIAQTFEARGILADQNNTAMMARLMESGDVKILDRVLSVMGDKDLQGLKGEQAAQAAEKKAQDLRDAADRENDMAKQNELLRKAADYELYAKKGNLSVMLDPKATTEQKGDAAGIAKRAGAEVEKQSGGVKTKVPALTSSQRIEMQPMFNNAMAKKKAAADAGDAFAEEEAARDIKRMKAMLWPEE